MLTDQDIKRLTVAQRKVFVTKDDLVGIKVELVDIKDRMATKVDLVSLEGRIKQELGDLEEKMVSKYSDLQMSVDRYLKFTETWHQELTILKGRQDRLSQVLIGKGIVSEKDLALLG